MAEFKLTILPAGLAPSSTNYLDLVRSLNVLYGASAMVDFKFERINPAPANIYQQKFTTIDGRTWKQIVTFATDNDGDPNLKYSSNDTWKIAEITQNIPLRSICITIKNTNPTLDLIKAEWS